MTTRRDFLKKMTASTMVLPLISDINGIAKPVADGKQLRIVFCGLGSYARRCADAIKDCKNVKLVGAISGTPSKLAEWQTKYFERFIDYSQIIEEIDIQESINTISIKWIQMNIGIFLGMKSQNISLIRL